MSAEHPMQPLQDAANQPVGQDGEICDAPMACLCVSTEVPR
jgi:hypothetical protein